MYDVIFILPYRFSDHPIFPEGILKRSLENSDFSVGIIETPFHLNPSSFKILGRPKLFFAIIPGPVDSTVLNYTSTRKRRKEDMYQEDGNGFFKDTPPSIKYRIRPDRTVIVFSSKIKEIYKNVPIVIGGIEATLRRFAHYNFLDNSIRRSILLDSRANILVKGNGEKQIVKIAQLLSSGLRIEEIRISGIVKIEKELNFDDFLMLPSYEEIKKNRELFLKATLITEKNDFSGKIIVQPHSEKFVVQYGNEIYTVSDIEKVYSFSYTRLHLKKKEKLTPALKFNLFSVQTHRGCGGGCLFCSINFHEGKKIVSRSIESIIKEIYSLKKHPLWEGIIHDLSSPSPEMYGKDCKVHNCKRPSCVYKKKCSPFKKNENFLKLLKEIAKLKGVKTYIGSGFRFDLLIEEPEILERLLLYHTKRFLRVAPEHTEGKITHLMRKPDFSKFKEFMNVFKDINSKLKNKKSIIPYIMVGFPGETFKDSIIMKKKLKSLGIKRVDVQIFTPTPGTIATAMYYAELNENFEKIPVEKKIRNLVERKNLIANLK